MTLIIYKNGTIYADRVCSSDGEILGYATKIAVSDDGKSLACACGNAKYAQKFLDNFNLGLSNNDTFKNDNHFTSSGHIMYIESGIHRHIHYNQEGIEVRILKLPFQAFGIAAQVALGMLISNVPPKDIFKIVHDNYYPIIGTEIDKLKLNSCEYE